MAVCNCTEIEKLYAYYCFVYFFINVYKSEFHLISVVRDQRKCLANFQQPFKVHWFTCFLYIQMYKSVFVVLYWQYYIRFTCGFYLTSCGFHLGSLLHV